MPVSSAPVTISDRSLSQVHAHCAPGYLLNTYIELMSTASPKCTWPGRSDPSPMLVTYISCCKFVTFAQMIHRHLKLCTFRASPSPPLLFLFQETAKKRKTKKERAVPSTQLLPVPPKTHTHTPTGHVLDSLSPALKAVLSPSSVPLPLKCLLSSALIPLIQIAIYHLRSGIPSNFLSLLFTSQLKSILHTAARIIF